MDTIGHYISHNKYIITVILIINSLACFHEPKYRSASIKPVREYVPVQTVNWCICVIMITLLEMPGLIM